MSYRLSYRSDKPISADQEAAIRSAADTFNRGRTWVLAFFRNELDGHLLCVMKCLESPSGEVTCHMSNWPGAYEAQCLLDGLCGVSRDCRVDWEIRDPYCTQPIGMIRAGVCYADTEAQAEAARNMAETLSRQRPN